MLLARSSRCTVHVCCDFLHVAAVSFAPFSGAQHFFRSLWWYVVRVNVVNGRLRCGGAFIGRETRESDVDACVHALLHDRVVVVILTAWSDSKTFMISG